MRREQFHVISNHSCLGNLERYESHCKIKTTLFIVSSTSNVVFLAQLWCCRGDAACVHTDSGAVPGIHLCFCVLYLYPFSSTCASLSSLLGEGGIFVSEAVSEYSEVFSIHQPFYYFCLLYLILLAWTEPLVLECWLYSSRYLTQCWGKWQRERACLMEF